MDAELLAALESGATIVTASARLARALGQQYDTAQIAAGRRLWAEPPILAWEEWMASLAAGLPDSGQPPYVATAGQEAALWRQIIAAERGAGEARALAAEAAVAWRLSRNWRIAPEPVTAETEAFAMWASEMRRELERRQWLTTADLPDWAREHGQAGSRGPEAGLVLPLGFQHMTPQQRDFFAAWQAAGGTVLDPAPPAANVKARVTQGAFTSEGEEAEAAAAWARRHIEAGARRVGIVALDLSRRRAELERAFALALAPAAWLPGGPSAELALHITLGQPLSQQPVVAAALRLLRAIAPGAALEMADAEALVTSPYLPDAAAERAARGRLAMELSATRQWSLTLGDVLRLAGRMPPALSRLTGGLRAARQAADGWPRRQSASDWAEAFGAAMRAAGWPGGRSGPGRGEILGSGEFQAAEKWPELLEALSRLSEVLPPLTASEATAELEDLAAARMFQPEAGAAAVTVLSPEASAGERFDAIWILGLEAGAWPPPVRLNFWLPAAGQRAAGPPQATPELARQWAAEVLASLSASAKEVVASYAPREEDTVATPSPLVADWPPYLPAPAAQWPRDAATAATEPIPDQPVAPAPPPNPAALEIQGGSAVFTNQSQCPFRAFARHRLGAEEYDAPASGLDAMARGELLHDVLRRIFHDLAGPDGAITIPGPSECANRARQAAEAAIEAARKRPAMAALRSPAFADLEGKRLAQTAAEWLTTVEATRPPFSVVGAEEKQTSEIGGLRIHWRADRLDRLEGGGTAIVDFKSGGRHGPGDWAGERPWDLQLPLYAVLVRPAAVAFAKLQPGEMGFAGWAEAGNLLAGCKSPKGGTWSEHLSVWRAAAERLAAEFLAGHAAVDPLPGACDNCGLEILCRVGEQAARREQDNGGDGGDE